MNVGLWVTMPVGYTLAAICLQVTGPQQPFTPVATEAH